MCDYTPNPKVEEHASIQNNGDSCPQCTEIKIQLEKYESKKQTLLQMFEKQLKSRATCSRATKCFTADVKALVYSELDQTSAEKLIQYLPIVVPVESIELERHIENELKLQTDLPSCRAAADLWNLHLSSPQSWVHIFSDVGAFLLFCPAGDKVNV